MLSVKITQESIVFLWKCINRMGGAVVLHNIDLNEELMDRLGKSFCEL